MKCILRWLSRRISSQSKALQQDHELLQKDQDTLRLLNQFDRQLKATQITDAELQAITDGLEPGELSTNANWMHIQKIGKFINPVGSDPVIEIVIRQRGSHQSEANLVARLEVTNAVYAEWLIACSNSMWHTQQVTAYDRHGQPHFLGKMLNTEVTQEYLY